MEEKAPFILWGASHRMVVALTAGGVLALALGWRGFRPERDEGLRRAAAAALLANELISWTVAMAQGVARVPLQLCDLAAGATVIALWTLHPAVSELAYFWGLAGSFQAIATPDLRSDFPDYWWVKFFLTHCGVVLSAVYLALTGRVAPTQKTVWKVWGLTNLYAAAAGLLNWSFGTNYGYLAHKPSQSSLLDYLGPWPWYILGMEGIALASLFLFYAPFMIGRRAGRQAA